jgi:spore maturation protein CgeB
MAERLKIAFFGSSLVSAYWNGAATYYRGIIRTLSRRGHRVTFYEPDAFDRQKNRDMPNPDWAEVVVYPAETDAAVLDCLEEAESADVIVKASGVGVFDELLEHEISRLSGPSTASVFWDVDAPATLQRLDENADDPFHEDIPHFDLVLTYGGGPPVVDAYHRRGAMDCVPIYNAVSIDEYVPVEPDPRFLADLSFLGNRLPDREERVMDYFFGAAAELPDRKFLLGGSGWHENLPQLSNVDYRGHIFTHEHNAFNSSPLAVLNISRESMAANGFSPATRVFEAAGSAACLITDAWEGIEQFLEPDREVLVASGGDDVARLLSSLTPGRALQIGRAARERVRREHTYAHRAVQVEEVLLSRTPGRQPVIV